MPDAANRHVAQAQGACRDHQVAQGDPGVDRSGGESLDTGLDDLYLAGEFGAQTDDDAWAVQREDGSWLMDGLIPVPELKDRLELKDLPDEERGRYNTLAGMVMLLLGRLPRTADVVQWQGWQFEVVDLDGKRVDKVLVSRLEPSPTPQAP